METVNIYREELYKQFSGIGAEVGVFRGLNAIKILNASDCYLYCIDCWKAVGRRKAKHQGRYYRQAKSNLNPYLDRCKIIRKYSMQAVEDFRDESLDFVYIDANHSFDFVMMDIIKWSKKVRPGGIVSGHDYYKSRREGVVTAVNAYVKEHNIKELFLTKGGRKGKEMKARSWFWIK